MWEKRYIVYDQICFNSVCLCPVQTLIEAVVRRLRSCVDEDVFIPLYPKKSVS